MRCAGAETRLVSASDKLHNVSTILADYRQHGEAIWKRFNGGREGTLWYYRALSDEYRRRSPNRITRELEIAIAELERAVDKKPRPPKEFDEEVREEKSRSRFWEVNHAPNARSDPQFRGLVAANASGGAWIAFVAAGRDD